MGKRKKHPRQIPSSAKQKNRRDDPPPTAMRVQQTPESNQESQHATNEHGPFMKPFIGLYRILFDGRSAAWTAIFTAVITWYTIQLTYISDLANRNNVAAQRPFVYLAQQINGSKLIDKGAVTGMRFHLRLENSGNTPATNVWGRSTLQVRSERLTEGFDFPDGDTSSPSPTILGPRGYGEQMLDVPLNDFFQVVQKKQFLYIWGWVMYSDTLASTPFHLTEFCFELTGVAPSIDTTSLPPTETFDVSDPKIGYNFTFNPCAVSHHCVDESCPDYAALVAKHPASS
ncbi:MAG: hypothetical protein HOP16_20155 [Acidobacteria bacterium]|nr:hypothetical protein [Acidobacteriota bacterium]